MSDTTTTLPPGDALEPCTLCYYPSWSSEDRPLAFGDEYEVSLEDFAAASSSADNGCVGCRFLSQVWQLVIPDASDRQEPHFNFNRSSENLWIHIFGKGGVHNIDTFTLHDEPSFKHVRIASLLPPSTHLEHNLSYIRTWLTECQSTHSKCNSPVSYVPKRLIDVENEDPHTVKLVEPPPALQPQYACLSHCWGQVRSKHITYSGNLVSNMKAIPASELPKTFRDAIEITKTLGLRYLWIDSLCIVQDSEPDWAAHVGRMASIYEHAYITLAAGASNDDEGGFFAVPEERFTRVHLLPLELDDGLRKIYVRYSVNHPDADWPASEVLPLMRRGWCFQERLLSRRYLCFGSTEILWECMEDVACTCSMASGPFNPRSSDRVPSFSGCSATKLQLSSATGDHRTLWRDLASQYNARELTYARDKLPALAGLADAFQRKFSPGTYHYGMWSSLIERDLSWYVFSNESAIGRPRKGPSWSWTQSGRFSPEIRHARLHEDDYYQLHQIIEPKEGGEVSNFTALLLSGTILAVSLQIFELKDGLESAYFLFKHCHVFEHKDEHFSTKEVDKLTTAVSIPPLPVSVTSPPNANDAKTSEIMFGGSFLADYRFWSSEEELQQELQHVIFFILGIENFDDPPSSAETEEEPCWVAGMVLRPANTWSEESAPEDVDRFERIGWLRYRTNKTRDAYTPGGRKTKFLIV